MKNSKKLFITGLSIELIFLIILLTNFLAFESASSSYLRISIIVEVIIIIIAKNYLKDKILKSLMKK